MPGARGRRLPAGRPEGTGPGPGRRGAARRGVYGGGGGGRYGREPGGPHRGQKGVVGIGGHGLRGAREPGVLARGRSSGPRRAVLGRARFVLLHPATVGR
ncbi:hypothetical protein Stube_21670 [Streptomyces tubercidicus]|uniref:Uncharacterized protein n=1 Tax=Streptomyces tubercidicus TaxID=47759 RepID=A0A640UQ17_9ACTN|nr:hypothetical protein Stube_21670 [Streptomyces tubercidicus]